jgi:aryl-alcohol dehydrogenase-like predicted oxidoreductase
MPRTDGQIVHMPGQILLFFPADVTRTTRTNQIGREVHSQGVFPQMDYRSFGRTALRVSEIGFGCSRLSGTADYKSDKEVLSILLQAFDRGVNFYDTADVYAQGRSERLLGEAFRNKRGAVIIATKAGYHLTAAGTVVAKLKPLLRPLVPSMRRAKTQVQRAQRAWTAQNFSPDYIRRAIDGSLRRLKTDYLDVFQLHSPSPDIIETGDFIPTLEHAKSQGKIRWYGISCRAIEDAALCFRHPGISSVQIPINLLEFKGATSLLALAAQKHLAVIARQPLASGYLAQPALIIKRKLFSAEEEESKEKLEQARAYQFLEQAASRTIAQAAIKFVLRLSGVSVVITGMSTQKHLAENLAAPACALTQHEVVRIYATFGEELMGARENI